MTRVHERHASAGPSAADRHRRADQKRKASYKVILEEVADKQKKLKTVLYPEQKAPRGYTFIPAGDPQLTNRCKKLAREDGFTVFIVSTSRHPRQGLSREIHRVGFHFPSVTVEKACDSLGITLSNSGRVLQSKFAHLEDGHEHDGRRPTKQKKQKSGSRNAQPALDISLPQAVIDTSARETIRDLFPNIPNQDLHVIVGRSFQKGKGLVGTVADLSLVRRAQLAVIAHIRHTYTDYDTLLRQVQYNEARRRVEKACLDRLIQWRGDDDGAGDMDDVLREVIVIPDDDEDDEGDETQESQRMRPEVIERDSSVEYISEADMQIQPVDYSTINRTVERGISYSPESDQDIQYLGRNQLRHGRQIQYDQHKLDRMGIHRQRIYEEALDRRRKHPEHLNVHSDHSSLPVFASSGRNGVQPPSQQSRDRSHPPHLAERGEQTLGREPVQTRLVPIARPDGYRADPYSNARDARYVEEQVVYSSQQDRRFQEGNLEQRKRIYSTVEDQSHHNGTRTYEMQQAPNIAFDLGDRFVSQHNPRQENGNNLYAHELEPQSRRRSDMVLPSIERDLPEEQGDQTSFLGATRQVNPFSSYQHHNRGTEQLPPRSIINLDDYEEPLSSKRRKIDDQQSINIHSQSRTILVPVEQIDGRRIRYERPYEAVYHDDTRHYASDKRIVPLPPKEEQTRPPITQQELQLFSPRPQMERRSDQVADRGERYPQPRDHYQVPLSRSESVENLQFPSRAVFAPPEYSKDSPSFFDSSQLAPRPHESSDTGLPSRHNFGVITDSDRVYSDSHRMMRRLQPLEVAERSVPSRFSDMSLDYRQRDEDPRPDRITYIPLSAAGNSHGHGRPSIVNDVLHRDREPPKTAYPHDISERHPAATSSDHPPSRMQRPLGLQQRPFWPVEQNTLPNHRLKQQYAEPDRANPFERHAPLPASSAAVESWSDTAFKDRFGLSLPMSGDTNVQSRNRPLGGPAEGRPPYNDMIAARPGNVGPVWREYDDFRLGQRKGPDNIVVLD